MVQRACTLESYLTRRVCLYTRVYSDNIDKHGGTMELPLEFEEKMKLLLGEEYPAYLDCYQEPRLYGLRVNTAKISVSDFVKICPFEIWRIPWIENGFYYDGETMSPAKHPYYFAGLYYLQEPSAMTPASRLPIFENEKVLDLCAAPGGKATQLGAELNNTGVLVANDISNSRAKGLLKNIELFGLGNALVLSEEPKKLAQYFFEYFDKILIDAPCSGEGMFRKDKKMMQEWKQRGPAYFAKIQREILLEAAKMLKPGGLLLYSTCTFDMSENEEAIAFLLQNFQEFEICQMKEHPDFANGIVGATKEQGEDFAKTIRLWPHRIKGEGHYLALLRKQACSPSSRVDKFRYKEVALPEECMNFLQDISLPFERARMEVIGEKVYYMPLDIPKIQGLRFLRTGLLLGELKKKRFEPSQALAMHLKLEEYKHTIDFSISDERVIRYLKGETIVLEEGEGHGGWNLIGVEGFPLGWGKCISGMLKNKYAKGWRWE